MMLKHGMTVCGAKLGAWGAALLLGMGCGKAPLPPADQTYTVRGVIDALPDPSDKRREYLIEHAAIPEFKNNRGETVGMDTMTMPFPMAPDVDVSGLAVGDPVELTFEVRWTGDTKLQVTKLQELPAGTIVEMGSLPDEDESTAGALVVVEDVPATTTQEVSPGDLTTTGTAATTATL